MLRYNSVTVEVQAPPGPLPRPPIFAGPPPPPAPTLLPPPVPHSASLHSPFTWLCQKLRYVPKFQRTCAFTVQQQAKTKHSPRTQHAGKHGRRLTTSTDKVCICTRWNSTRSSGHKQHTLVDQHSYHAEHGQKSSPWSGCMSA